MKNLCIVIVLLWSIGLSAYAQDDDAPEPIYIYSEVNLRDSFTTDFARGQSLYTPDLHMRIAEYLEDTGYDIVFIAPGVDADVDLFTPDYDSDTVFASTAPTVSVTLTPYTDLDSALITAYVTYEFAPLPWASPTLTALLNISDDASLDLGARLAAAMALYVRQDCEVALTLFDDAINTLESAEADTFGGLFLTMGPQVHRGNCLYMLGDIDGAIDAYQIALTDPIADLESADMAGPIEFVDYTMTNLAFFYTEQGENAQAVETLNAMRDMDIEFPRSSIDVKRFVERATLYIAAGESDNGIAEMDRIIGLVEAQGDALAGFILAQAVSERGRLYAQIGMDDEALADFAAAIEADADYALTYYWRGVFYAERGESDLAAADLNRFLELGEDIPQNFWRDIAPDIDDARARLNDLG